MAIAARRAPARRPLRGRWGDSRPTGRARCSHAVSQGPELLRCTVLEPDVFGNLVGYIEDGQVRPLVARTYPLAEIAQAQVAFQTKTHTGKIVLSVQDVWHDNLIRPVGHLPTEMLRRRRGC